MQEKKNRFSMGIGSLSILMVFVVLCLTTFATLSLASANADQKLSQKTVDATAKFYELDRYAEESMSKIAALLEEEKQKNTTESDYWNGVKTSIEKWDEPNLPVEMVDFSVLEDGTQTISYRVTQTESVRMLQVTLDVSSSFLEGKKAIKRLAWQIVINQKEQKTNPQLWSGVLPNA